MIYLIIALVILLLEIFLLWKFYKKIDKKHRVFFAFGSGLFIGISIGGCVLYSFVLLLL